MKYTEQQLKSALVRALPERLEYNVAGDLILWKMAHSPVVTPHEWPAIVQMVEDKLTDVEWDRYDSARHFHLSRKYGFNLAENRLHFMRVFSGQEFRAQALADIGAINVEEEK